MDSKSLELLEFPKVRELVAGYTSFEASSELVREIYPLTDASALRALLEQSAEARRLLDVDTGFNIGPLSDIRDTLKMAALGKVLEPLSLFEILQTIVAMRLVRRNLERRKEDLPRLWEIASGIIETPDIEREINRCVNQNGEIPDSASSELGSVRRRIKRTREAILSKLDATLKSDRGRLIAQEPIITEREGRYVIPIKVEHRKDIRGIVHDMSNTGVTLFIEPWGTLELGNELRQLISEEKNEIERILRDLSLKVAAHASDIAKDVGLVAKIDVAVAKAKYSIRARAFEPIIGERPARSATLKLANARHPLLGDKAVPLSVEIGRDFSILVITGPNMGGKTVALKTIGLLSAMALSGLPIPASSESVVPMFDGIFSDIGDEQSIEKTVSTFSWHVGNIVRIIEQSSGDSLVLLDELGSSTDPAEGSALARSILLYLLSEHTLAVATTHFDDLKAFAHTTDGLRNSSLDFDPDTGLPTYHLTVGIPGGSNALGVAERLGLPASIIERARQMLGKGTEELESLLADLNAQRARVEHLRVEAERERKTIVRKQAELDNRRLELLEEEKRIVQTTRDAVVREAGELQSQIRQAVADLKKTRTNDGVELARRAVAEVQRQLKSDIWHPDTIEPEQPIEDGSIKAGDIVLLRDANIKGTVLSLSENNSQAEVQAGNARLTISLNSLEKVVTVPGEPKAKFVPITKQVSRAPVSLQLDLRGKRASDIEPELDDYLNNASMAGIREVRIIHGMATGTVRKIVREILSEHQLVRSFRPAERGEGGDGATVVKL